MASSYAREDLDWILGKKIVIKKFVKLWNWLPRKVVELPSPAVSKRLVVLRGML